MKRNIENFLIWALGKVNKARFVSLNVGLKTTVDLEKFIPADNNWRNVQVTADFFLKRTVNGLEEYKTGKVYIDGVKLEIRE